jgi:quercetin dioxygenase-like cupin family protein
MRAPELADLQVAEQQPIRKDFILAGDVAVVAMIIPEAGTIVPQHAHNYDHVSYVASGAVHVWADGEYLGETRGPDGIVIRAGVKHLFQAVDDGTVVLCIHRIDRSGEIEIAEEHQILGAPA